MRHHKGAGNWTCNLCKKGKSPNLRAIYLYSPSHIEFYINLSFHSSEINVGVTLIINIVTAHFTFCVWGWSWPCTFYASKADLKLLILLYLPPSVRIMYIYIIYVYIDDISYIHAYVCDIHIYILYVLNCSRRGCIPIPTAIMFKSILKVQSSKQTGFYPLWISALSAERGLILRTTRAQLCSLRRRGLGHVTAQSCHPLTLREDVSH